MKKNKSLLTLMGVILVAIFMLNMTVMYVFFNINILDPRALLYGIITFQKDRDELKEADGTKAAEENALRESSLSNEAETNTIPKSGDTASYFMTPDEIALLSHLGMEDKFTAITILSKLGMKELDRIYKMSLDGVNNEEFDDIKTSVERKLAVSDVEVLKEILYRNKMLYAENGR